MIMNAQELYKLIDEQQPNICQIAAYKDNIPVYSATWNGYRETDCVHIASVTKSIISLLVGIAIEKGFQPGGKSLREAGVNLKSLAIVQGIENGEIVLAPED